VWSIRAGDGGDGGDSGDVEASLQTASFRRGVSADDPRVRRAVVRAIGGGVFRLGRLGNQRVYTLEQPEQHIALWFAPDGRSYVLLVARAAFTAADDVLAAALEDVRGAPIGPRVAPFDPRQGDDS
jgi:hypothetical protein